MVRWVPGFVALSAIWGSSFALIEIAVDAGVAPLWVALWRCLFGALTLLALCLVTRAPLPRAPRVWAHAGVVAVLLNAMPFALFAYAQTRVSSVLAGVLNATTPLTTLLFALALVPGERPTATRLTGLATGFVGVLVVLEIWRGGEGGLLPAGLACLGATTCYGAGFAYTRRFFSHRRESVTALSAAQISCATLHLALVTPWIAGAPAWPGAGAAAALLALGALGTGVVYILNLTVIRGAGPTIASTVTYLTPVWSTVLGSVLLGERFGTATLLGAVLVLVGVYVASRRSAIGRRAERAAEPVGSAGEP